MSKAKEELSKLSEQAKNSAAAGQAAAIGQPVQPKSPDPSLAAVSEEEPSAASTTGEGVAQADATVTAATASIGLYGEVFTSPDATPRAATSPSGNGTSIDDLLPQANAFFSRVSSQIQTNPNLANFQKNLSALPTQVSTTLTQAKGKIPPTSVLNAQLEQGNKLAEEYRRKGEAYFNKAGKELGTFMNQAVRIVPPSEASTSSSTGISAASAAKERKEEKLRQAVASAAGRKDGLLQRLQANAHAILLVDPAVPAAAPTDASEASPQPASIPDAREQYAAFLQTIEDAGGFESQGWQVRIETALKEAADLTPAGATSSLQTAYDGLGERSTLALLYCTS